MKRKLLTDTELRSRWRQIREQGCTVEEGTILTPAAQDFIREHRIVLNYVKSGEQKTMTRTPIPVHDGKAAFVDALTGETLEKKGEDMTHLRGNLLVPKIHPRIEFRGRLDSLTAEILGVQLLAAGEEPRIAEDLEDVEPYLCIQRAVVALLDVEPARVEIVGRWGRFGGAY